MAKFIELHYIPNKNNSKISHTIMINLDRVTSIAPLSNGTAVYFDDPKDYCVIADSYDHVKHLIQGIY